MKKRFFYASLLLAAATLNSCSQDSDLVADEAAAAAAGALTPEQRAQIMELAEYYDLDVTIDDRPATRGAGQEFNIDSVEAEFRRVASLKGEYTCVQADSGEAMFQKETIKAARPLRLTRMMGETTSGDFIQDKFVFGYWMTFRVSWSWGIESPGKVNVDVEAGSGPYDIAPVIESYTFMSIQPGFYFSGKLHLINRNTLRIAFRIPFSGSYLNKIGEIYVG